MNNLKLSISSMSYDKKNDLKVKNIHKWDGPTGLEVEFCK